MLVFSAYHSTLTQGEQFIMERKNSFGLGQRTIHKNKPTNRKYHGFHWLHIISCAGIGLHSVHHDHIQRQYHVIKSTYYI